MTVVHGEFEFVTTIIVLDADSGFVCLFVKIACRLRHFLLRAETKERKNKSPMKYISWVIFNNIGDYFNEITVWSSFKQATKWFWERKMKMVGFEYWFRFGVFIVPIWARTIWIGCYFYDCFFLFIPARNCEKTKKKQNYSQISTTFSLIIRNEYCLSGKQQFSESHLWSEAKPLLQLRNGIQTKENYKIKLNAVI